MLPGVKVDAKSIALAFAALLVSVLVQLIEAVREAFRRTVAARGPYA